VEFKFSREFLNKKFVDTIRHDAKAIVDVARKGNIPYIRIYNPLPPFPKFNIFGVDYPFNKEWGRSSLKLFDQLNFRSILNEANKKFKRNDLDSLSVARIHWNGYTSYRGLWHRDGLLSDNDTNDVICVLYLLKESGFLVIPHENDQLLKEFNYPEINSSLQPTSFQNEIDIDHLSYKVSAEPGDMFMFNAGLLHKGVVNGPRLHIHLRLTSSKSPSNNHLNNNYKKYNDFYLASQYWPSESLTKKNIPIKTYILNKWDPKNMFIYIKRLITYVIPFPSISFVKYFFLKEKNLKRPKYNIKSTLYDYLYSFLKNKSLPYKNQ